MQLGLLKQNRDLKLIPVTENAAKKFFTMDKKKDLVERVVILFSNINLLLNVNKNSNIA